MKTVLYFTLSLFLIVSCKEKQNLESQVIAIHDEVMPKMGEIHLAKKKLKEAVLKFEGDTLNNDVLKIISDLEKADEGMMNWMDKWNVPNEEPAKTKYLEAEKIKITKVKVDILSSLEAADQYLSKINTK